MKRDPLRERILTYLKEVDEATPTQIHKECKIHYYLLGMYLKNLENEGLIISRKNETGKYTYWKLAEREEKK